MKLTKIAAKLGVMSVFALLLSLQAQTAYAQIGIKYYVVSNTENVYVRHEPVGMVLGTLFGKDDRTGRVRHDRFAVVLPISPKGWAWGRAEGNVDRCGWVKLWEGESKTPSGKVYLKPLNGGTVKVQTACGPPRTIPPSTFRSRECGVRLSNGKEDGCPAKLKGMNVKIYGNLKGGGLLDERKFSPLARDRGPGRRVQRQIKFRYVTNNGGRFVMVRSPYGKDRWGFIKRADICLPGDRCP